MPSRGTHTGRQAVNEPQTAAMLQTRVRLDGLRMPTHWYDLCADLPLPLSPPLRPGTLQPVSPDDLASLFPMALTGPEVSTEREIPIPTPGPAQRPGRREEAHHRDRRPASGDRRCSSPAACSVGRARAPSPRRCAATPRAAASPSSSASAATATSARVPASPAWQTGWSTRPATRWNGRWRHPACRRRLPDGQSVVPPCPVQVRRSGTANPRCTPGRAITASYQRFTWG